MKSTDVSKTYRTEKLLLLTESVSLLKRSSLSLNADVN
jgi:hypothetical protein